MSRHGEMKITNAASGKLRSELNINQSGKTHAAARNVIPILIAYAQAGQTLTYSELVRPQGLESDQLSGYVLGHVQEALEFVSGQISKKVPPLMAIAVSKKTGLPSPGLYKWFPEDVKDITGDVKVFQKRDKKDQRAILSTLYRRLQEFQHWDRVLDELGLEPNSSLSPKLILAAGHGSSPRGESQEHRLLKEYVYSHPGVVGLRAKHPEKAMEFEFPSADRADVLFKTKKEWVVAEVKPTTSNEADLLRGIFQCVKYRALLEALQITEEERKESRAVLVLGGKLSAELRQTASLLAVPLVEEVRASG